MTVAKIDKDAPEKERLETLLLEGLASGYGQPMTDARWTELRKRAEKRLTAGERHNPNLLDNED